MQLNHQACNYCGSLMEGSSDDGSLIFASRNNLRKVLELMMIEMFRQVIEPCAEDLIRKVVSQSVQSVLDKLITIEHRQTCEAEITSASKRTLQLMFLDEVSGPVLTGKEIKTTEDKPIKVALIDKKTGTVVNSGPESRLRVEIVLVDASEDRISKEGDKKKQKPHLSKTKYVVLNEGEGVLQDIKLGQDSSWTRTSKCKLGARIVRNINGVQVLEGWTKSFMVHDSRGKLYEKGNPPCLSDPLWKLENIGRSGDPVKRLKKKNVKTVKDFLFLNSINPLRLQEIYLGEKRKLKEAAAIPNWDAIVQHAKTCNIDDDTNIYVYFSSESQTSVVFNVVGGLKGLIDESHYIPVNNLSEDDKGQARELLLSAFENQKDIKPFPNESSLLERYPYPSNDVDVAANPVQEVTATDPLSTFEHDDGDFSTEQSHTFIIPNGLTNNNKPDLTHVIQSPNYYNSYFGYDLWNYGENEILASIFPAAETSLRQQIDHNRVRLGWIAIRLMVRATKRFKASGNEHRVQKRLRIH